MISFKFCLLCPIISPYFLAQKLMPVMHLHRFFHAPKRTKMYFTMFAWDFFLFWRIAPKRTITHQNRKIRGLWVFVGLWLGFWCDPKYLKTTLCYEISPNENSVFWRVFSTFLVLAFCITKTQKPKRTKTRIAWKSFKIHFGEFWRVYHNAPK